MGTIGQLIKATSEALLVSPGTVTVFAHNLRDDDERLLDKGGRGTSAARMTPLHGARMLIAFLGADKSEPKSAADAVRFLSKLPLAQIEKLPPAADSPGEVVVVGAGISGTPKSLVEVNDKYSAYEANVARRVAEAKAAATGGAEPALAPAPSPAPNLALEKFATFEGALARLIELWRPDGFPSIHVAVDDDVCRDIFEAHIAVGDTVYIYANRFSVMSARFNYNERTPRPVKWKRGREHAQAVLNLLESGAKSGISTTRRVGWGQIGIVARSIQDTMPEMTGAQIVERLAAVTTAIFNIVDQARRQERKLTKGEQRKTNALQFEASALREKLRRGGD